MSGEPVATTGLISTAAEITVDWARAVLGPAIAGVEVERVGTGQIGTCYRVRLDAAPGAELPASVLVKLPAEDPATRPLLAGVYRSEVRFYAEIAPTVAVRVPATHLATFADDGAEFTLVMGDAAPAEQGDQLAGCTPAQARDAVVNLAGLHGPRWCDPTLLAIDGLSINGPDDAALMAELFGPATDIFVDGLGDLLGADTVATLRDVAAVIGPWALGRAERFGLVHGDYRLDNLLFPPGGAPGVVAVDWQTLSLALPARDLAFFTGTGLESGQRRAEERDLVAAYHAALTGHGVADYDLDLCWEDYRFAMLQGPLVAVFGCAYGTRTDRGDRMFAAMVERACSAIRELGSLDLVM
ncbi:phosphotransferase family protein [Nocardioides sambongensis]|uniref:phosphotransferase family protein n=1 Tax=Nocardioides sambongensis TaxID=2589074 RepID=UPI0011264229|nr:aminoglycoside phosphotransferase family protein [Nocardioides sambongensis]